MIVRVEHDLRMPLDAQSAWIIDQFNGFHDAVLRTAADAQTFSKIPDTLVMIAVGPDPIAEQAVERAARFQMNQMADITAVRGLHVLKSFFALKGIVLVQGSATGYIHIRCGRPDHRNRNS